MGIEVISIGSSSSGNSYIIRTADPESVILLDVGLTAKRIIGALSENGIEPEDVDAVLITHEHTDHVRSVRAISRKCCNALFCASRGTIENTANFGYVPEDRIRVVVAGDVFSLTDAGKRGSDAAGAAADHESEYSDNCNNVTISAFSLSHDAAEPIGFTISAGDDKLAVVTDTGTITDEIYSAVSDADKLVLESNHDEHLLMFGDYPYRLKLRIKSDYGHLSNDSAAHMLRRLLRENHMRRREPHIMLAHLSEHNNLPMVAEQTVRSLLVEDGFETDRDFTLQIASKEVLTVMR